MTSREWCPGSNKPAENTVEKMQYGQQWSRCGQCGRNTAVSLNGNLWKHKRDVMSTETLESRWWHAGDKIVQWVLDDPAYHKDS